MATKTKTFKRFAETDIRPLAQACNSKEITRCLIEDDELERVGINSGDTVIIQLRDWDAEGDENRLTVWHTRAEPSALWFGYAFENFGEISIFWTCRSEPTRYKRKDIVFVGEVVGVIKLFTAPPFIPVEVDNENQVECDECEKTGTGDPKFLKAMGWYIREGETLCTMCRR